MAETLIIAQSADKASKYQSLVPQIESLISGEPDMIAVPNVDEFPGHIACSSDSKSEIVLPAIKNGQVTLVLDVDSDKLNDFDETDALYLKQIMVMIERFQ